MSSELTSNSTSNGLGIVLNQLYCYVCSSYFADRNSFTTHKHNQMSIINQTVSNDEFQEYDGNHSEMEVDIKTEPESTELVIVNCETVNNNINDINKVNCNENENRDDEMNKSKSNCADTRKRTRMSTQRQSVKRKTRSTVIQLKPTVKNPKMIEEKLIKITHLIKNLQQATTKILGGQNNDNRSCLESSDSVNVTCNSCFVTFKSLKKFHLHLKFNVQENEENLSCTNNNNKKITPPKPFTSTSKIHIENQNSNSNSASVSSNFNDDDCDENIPSPSDSNEDSCQTSTSKKSKIQEKDDESDSSDGNYSCDSDSDEDDDDDDQKKDVESKKQKPSEKIPSPQKIVRPRKNPTCKQTEAHIIATEECKKVKQNSAGKYPCPRDGCSKTFSRFLGLKLHVMDHNGQRPYKCEEPGCDRAFLVPRQLRAHILRAHRPDSEKPFLCSVCGKGFIEQCRLNAHHRQKHSIDHIYKCTIEGCTKAYTSHSSLAYHITTHTSGFPFPCKFDGCTKKFKNRATLSQHKIHTHSEEKRYECSKCGMKLKQKRSLEHHLKLHEEAEKEQDEQNKEGKKFILLEPDGPFRPPQRRRKFRCPKEGCVAAFKKEEKLQEHLLKHETGETEIRSFKCQEPNCTALFESQSRLKTHIENVHKKIRNVLCSMCGSQWPNQCALRVHMATHTAEKRYKCGFEGCNYASFQFACIEKHAVIHTNARCYKCKICEKGFNHQITLKRHLLTHTGEKPHKCPLCPVAYPEKRNLKNHMKKHELEKQREQQKQQEVEESESESDAQPETDFIKSLVS